MPPVKSGNETRKAIEIRALVIRADGANVLVARGMAAVMSVETAIAALRQSGLGCWRAIVTLKLRGLPRLRRLRLVVEGSGTWAEAGEAYLRRWIAAERERPPRARCPQSRRQSVTAPGSEC